MKRICESMQKCSYKCTLCHWSGCLLVSFIINFVNITSRNRIASNSVRLWESRRPNARTRVRGNCFPSNAKKSNDIPWYWVYRTYQQRITLDLVSYESHHGNTNDVNLPRSIQISKMKIILNPRFDNLQILRKSEPLLK